MSSGVASVEEARGGSARGGGSTFAAIAGATHVAVSDPGQWLLGALSFCVRGGLLVILLPILWIPSPVVMSVYLGGFITTSGVSADAVPVAISLIVAVLVGLVGAVLLAAYTQLSSFERVASRHEAAELRLDRPLRSLTTRERFGVVLRLSLLQVIGLVPVLLFLPIVGEHIGEAGLAELQLPTSTDTPLVIAILERVQNDLLLLAAVVVVTDLLVALAGHQLLASRFGVARSAGRSSRHPDLGAIASGAFRVVRQPLRTLFLFVIGWLVTIGAVAVVIGSSVLSLSAVRALLFEAVPTDPEAAEIAIVLQLVALAILGAIWVLSITLVGFASSLRGALWTTNALH